MTTPEPINDKPFQPLSAQKKKRNWAIFAVLFGLVAVIYAITLIKLGGSH